VVINLFNFFRHYKSPFHILIRIHLISLSYHILVVLPSHFSFMEQMLTLMLIRRFNDDKDGDAFLFLPDCNIRYLFICIEALRQSPHYVIHHDAMANNAIKTNNYNWIATLSMMNINIYWTVYYATIYLLNFKHI